MKNWLKAIIYTPKHEKTADYSILRLLMPSFVGIVICMVCLAGSTWAWFTASISTPPQTIAAANFDMDVWIVDADSQPANETAAGRYTLSADTAYTVTLTAKGSATEYGGYCEISREGAEPLYTCQLIPPDGKMTFVFTPDTTADYTFTAVWGICPSDTPSRTARKRAVWFPDHWRQAKRPPKPSRWCGAIPCGILPRRTIPPPRSLPNLTA